MNRPPLERPQYMNSYILTGHTPYTSSIFHTAGYSTTSKRPNPCNCCLGFSGYMPCQYGLPCGSRTRGIKPDLVYYGCP